MYCRGGNLPPAALRPPSRINKTVSLRMCRWCGTVQPHRLYSKRGGRQVAAPTTKLFINTVKLAYLLLYCALKTQKTWYVPYGFAGGLYCSIARVVSVTLHGDESSPLHCVVPFNQTGYIRDVAGGRLPPLRQCTAFLIFYRTKIGNRNAKNMEIRNKCIVGAAICRPLRLGY